MNILKRFSETLLPTQRAFYNDLDETYLSDEDYLHAELVSVIFKFQNLGEYLDVYMETDVHLLADVFENF